MQSIQNAIGQLQDPFFYGNGVKTSGLYNAFTAEAFIRRMDAIRMRHHPMEDETAIIQNGREPPRRRFLKENWWLAFSLFSICDIGTSGQSPSSNAVGSVRGEVQVLLL
jgi:hypothetical protein